MLLHLILTIGMVSPSNNINIRPSEDISITKTMTNLLWRYFSITNCCNMTWQNHNSAINFSQLFLPARECMDYGSSGVWDSPMATDYWVKRFGFMWGGGHSGLHGLEAFKVIISSFHLQHKNLCEWLCLSGEQIFQSTLHCSLSVIKQWTLLSTRMDYRANPAMWWRMWSIIFTELLLTVRLLPHRHQQAEQQPLQPQRDVRDEGHEHRGP